MRGQDEVHQLRRHRPGPTLRRVFAFSLALVLHLGLLVALIVSRPATVVEPENPPVMLTLGQGDRPSDGQASAEGAPAAPASRPAQSALATGVLDPAPPIAAVATATGAAEAAAASSGPPGPPGAACNLAALLRGVLERDATVQGFLARLPATTEPVRLWDGEWLQPERVGGLEAIRTIRSAVAASLETGPEACRIEAMTGPVLLPVAGRSGPVVLAFGSAAWRWEDLIEAPAWEARSEPPR